MTRPSRDGGRDAVGQYRIGPPDDLIKIDFALEAKCYAPHSSVGVREVSRLISRLRHRNFGVLVTTSWVNAQAYKEIREDQHPVAIVCGRDIVTLLRQRGWGSKSSVVQWLEEEFPATEPGLGRRDDSFTSSPLSLQEEELAPDTALERDAARSNSWASSPGVRSRMQRQRSRDTEPELALRRILHARGLRYRVDRRLPLPNVRRRADIVFGPAKVAVFVDGCFWHGCPEHGNPNVRSNELYWFLIKIAANRMRDLDTDQRLKEIGWQSVRIWEHTNPEAAANTIQAVLSGSAPGR